MQHKIFWLGILMLLNFLSVQAQGSPIEGMARLRVAHYVLDAPALTVTVDDNILTEGTLEFRGTAAHVDVTAGEATIRFQHGNEVLAAGIVVLETNQDYTAALIGQVADSSVQVVLIPETELVAKVRDLANPASYAVLLHGISNGPTVDFTLDGNMLRSGLRFGEYDVFSISAAPHDILVTFTDDPQSILFQNTGETPPGNDLLLLTVMVGNHPDQLDVTGAVSRLPDRSVLTFLQSAQDAEGNGFNTLLEAIETAGLSELLATEGAFTLFAPTDAAFAALPAETRELLFAYPEALRAVLMGHIVDDVFIMQEVTEPLILTSRQGTPIHLASVDTTLQVNEQATILFGSFPVVTNGNVIGIDQVLIPSR